MKSFNKYILAASLATLACNVMAQGLNSGYFTDDYKFRHTLNPAYGNEQNYVSIPALGNANVRMQGNFVWAMSSSTIRATASTATARRRHS